MTDDEDVVEKLLESEARLGYVFLWNKTAEQNGFRQLQTCSGRSMVGFRPGICPLTKCRYLPYKGVVEFAEHDNRCLVIDDTGHMETVSCIVRPWVPEDAVFQSMLRSSMHVMCFMFRVANRHFATFTDIHNKKTVAILDLTLSDDVGKVVFSQSAISGDCQYAALLAQTGYDDWASLGDRSMPRSYSIYILHASGDMAVIDPDVQGFRHVRRLDRIYHVDPHVCSIDNHGLRLAFVPGFWTQFYLVFGARNWPIDGADSHVTKVNLSDHRVVGVLPDLRLSESSLGSSAQIQNVSFAQDGALTVICVGYVSGAEYIILSTELLQILARTLNPLARSLHSRIGCISCFGNFAPSISCSGLQMAVVFFHRTYLYTCLPPLPGDVDIMYHARMTDTFIVEKDVHYFRLPKMMLSLQSLCKLVVQRILWQSLHTVYLLPVPAAMHSYLSDW